MESFFFLLFIVQGLASIWGGVVLARKWVKSTPARIILALGLILIFVAAGTTAVISGCVAVVGPPNFH